MSFDLVVEEPDIIQYCEICDQEVPDSEINWDGEHYPSDYVCGALVIEIIDPKWISDWPLAYCKYIEQFRF